MARYEHLVIYKDAFDLTRYFDEIVRNFSRYNKYTHGAELRNLSRKILLQIVRANNAVDKDPHLLTIREDLEELKILLRLCKELRVFPNFNSYQFSINKVIAISRQNEGWLKSCRKSVRPESSVSGETGKRA